MKATPGFALLVMILAAWAGLALGEARLIDFEIKDQFDQVYRDEVFAGQVVCVIGSDRDGADYNRLWGAAISDSLTKIPGGEQVVVLPVADMRGVPFFLKGMIKGKFPKERENWILMDWGGEFAKAYDWVKGESNIFIFDGDGILLHQSSGRDPDPGTLPEIIIRIKGAVGQLSPSQNPDAPN